MTKRKIAVVILIFVIFSILQVSAFAMEGVLDSSIVAVKVFDDGNSHVLNENVEANGCEGAIYVENETKLIIDGGNIKGLLCGGKKCNDSTCGFCMALWAYGKGTEVIINDGYFTNETDGSNHCDLIYVKDGATIKIKGGTFKCSTPSWTLNSHDSNPGLIEVTGGRFYKFNPATANDEAGNNGNGIAPDGKVEVVVLEDYKVVQDGDWYEVVCAHKKCTLVKEIAASIVSEGQKEHYECDLCKKIFIDENAINEIKDKNSLIIPKLIEVVNNEAKVSEEAMDEAIEAAANSSTVAIPVLEASKNVTLVSIPVVSLNTVADADKTLLLETSDVKLTLDSKAIEKIAIQAGNAENVKIEVIKVEEITLNNKQKEAIKNQDVAVVISAKIIAGEKEISDFGGGKVKVEIPFVPAENTEGTDYKVVYIDDEGNVTIIPSKFVNGKMVVELEHFSEYAIVKDKKVNNVTTNNTSQETKDETPKTGAISIVTILAIISLAGLVLVKKRK